MLFVEKIVLAILTTTIGIPTLLIGLAITNETMSTSVPVTATIVNKSFEREHYVSQGKSGYIKPDTYILWAKYQDMYAPLEYRVSDCGGHKIGETYQVYLHTGRWNHSKWLSPQ